MAADETNGSARRLVAWWFGCVTAAIVVVALGVWLVARPNDSSATRSAADRPDTNGSVVGGPPRTPSSTATSGTAPRQAGISTPAPPVPLTRGKNPGDGPTRQPGGTQPQDQPVVGHPRKVVPTPHRVTAARSDGASQSITVAVTLQARTGRHATALLQRNRSALTVRAPGAFASISGRAERVVVTVGGRRATYSLQDALAAAPHP